MRWGPVGWGWVGWLGALGHLGTSLIHSRLHIAHAQPLAMRCLPPPQGIHAAMGGPLQGTSYIGEIPLMGKLRRHLAHAQGQHPKP